MTKKPTVKSSVASLERHVTENADSLRDDCAEQIMELLETGGDDKYAKIDEKIAAFDAEVAGLLRVLDWCKKAED